MAWSRIIGRTPTPAAIPEAYRTPLTPHEEQQFRAWMPWLNEQFGAQQDPNDPTYDLRGLWKLLQGGILGSAGGVMGVDPGDQQMHATDQFKTPYHPTASNESQYMGPSAPSWTPEGVQLDDTGQVTMGLLWDILGRGR